MTLKFCGAAREVTGSAHLLTLDDGFNILLDCGLYQGSDDFMSDFNKEWLFDPERIDAVVLSHAHIDHSGRLPKLVKDGFRGKIHATHATRSLCAIMLLDSAMIQERDAEYDNRSRQKYGGQEKAPLYTRQNAKATMDYFEAHAYNKRFHVHPDVTVEFRDAGHILGSANVVLHIQRSDGSHLKLGFTGDIGRPNRPILRDPVQMDPVDVLISESTYGNRIHESGPAEVEHLLQIIRETCVEQRGKLIIPAFSVGRTQEIVYILDQLENAGRLPNIPVYVDSPLSVNATVIFGTHPECYDDELSSYLLSDPNPFGFNRLTYITDAEESKKLNTSNQPAIIISSSGMANAGRIKHHLFHNIDKPSTTVLIVGYATPGTPAGKLRQGVSELRLFGETKPVKATVVTMDSFSAHGDRNEMLDFLSNQRNSAKMTFLVHGQYDSQEAFRTSLESNKFSKVAIPTLGQEFAL